MRYSLSTVFTSSVILKQVFVCHLSLRLMFAARENVSDNSAYCTTILYHLLAGQYTASGMHAQGKTTLSCFLTLSRRYATPTGKAVTQNCRVGVCPTEIARPSAEFICHPEIANITRGLYQCLRDLRLGASFGLDFGKDSP